VAGGAVTAVVSLGVGRKQPSHPKAEITVGMRPDHHVKMVGHQAVSQEVDVQTGAAIGHGPDEGVVIDRAVKDGLSAISAIEDVIPSAGDRGSSGSGHISTYQQGDRQSEYWFRPH
jgi:hypothetical protein